MQKRVVCTPPSSTQNEGVHNKCTEKYVARDQSHSNAPFVQRTVFLCRWQHSA